MNRVCDFEGAPFTEESLPPVDVMRWTIKRKANLVIAVKAGILTREEALRDYKISEEEFSGWEKAVSSLGGFKNLQATRRFRA